MKLVYKVTKVVTLTTNQERKIQKNITGATCVKTLAYTSLITPHLEFASAAWEPYTARDINQLDKVQVQRRAARL